MTKSQCLQFLLMGRSFKFLDLKQINNILMAIEDLELKKKKKNLKNGIAKEMEILEIENYAIFIWYNS